MSQIWDAFTYRKGLSREDVSQEKTGLELKRVKVALEKMANMKRRLPEPASIRQRNWQGQESMAAKKAVPLQLPTGLSFSH